MKKIILFGFLFVFSFSFAQNLNDYKYALIPSKFSFLNEVDQYRLNTLTKLLMGKYGFVAYLDNEVLPEEVLNNNCNKIYVDVVKLSGVFTTKLSLVLKDCKNNVLYTSNEGKSREKEYRVAYNEALRMAFDNFDALKTYKFQPSSKSLGMIGEPAFQESVSKENPKTTTASLQPLFAKPFENGFQLLTNNTNIPQYVMTIYKTSSPDSYIVTKENINGILIRKVGNWYFEYYKDNKLNSELVTIVNL